MSTRVFRTRRGRITLTVETLIYEEKREPHRCVSLARTEIIEIRIVTRVYWLTPARIDVMSHHRGGVLTISRVGRRTAEALKKALGF
jgi:hypothetical protein